jgi:WD40 repeat protein
MLLLQIWVGAGRTILRLKAQTAEPVDVLQGHDDQVNSLCDVEGREVWSASSDGSIIVWDARVRDVLLLHSGSTAPLPSSLSLSL